MGPETQKSEKEEKSLLSMNRRSFLKMTGLAAGTALMPLKSLIGSKSTGEVIEQAAGQSDNQNSENYTIFGNKATGIVEDGEHQFKFGGNIKNIYVEDGATVEVNGEEVTEQELSQLTEENCIIGAQTGSDGSGNDDGGSSNVGLTEVECQDIPDEGPVEIHGIEFQNIVNAVDDLGMDSAGNQPVDQAFRDAVADNTLIVFPKGSYLWEEEHDVENVSNFGMISSTCNPDDVKFEYPQGFAGTLAIRDGSVNVLVEGFEVAMTQDQETGTGIVVRVDDNCQVHNIDFTGFCPLDYPSSCLYAAVETTEGVGNISNIKIDGGGVIGVYPHRMNGIFSGIPHVGEMIIRNCDIRELGSSGIRFTGGEGAVKVEDCYFENVDNAALRLNGNDHAGGKESWAKGCKFVNDDSLVEYLPSDENYQNADMIRVDDSNHYFKGLLIEDCTFIHRSDPDEAFIRGCIARPGYAEHGSFTVRNCTMQIDDDGPEAIDAVNGSDELENTVKVENVHVTGSVESTASDSMIHIGESPDSVVRNCCIDTPNVKNGVRVEDSDNCTVENSAIAVSGEQVVSQNSTVETNDLSSTPDCRQPGDSTETGETHSHDIPENGPKEIHGIEFQNIVNAVDDLGMDPDGESPNDSELEKVWNDESTLIKFPPGEYIFEERHDSNSLKDFGMIGTGDSREDTVIRTKDGESKTIVNIQGGPGGFLMENITLKNNLYESKGTKDGAVSMIVNLDDNIKIYNCLHTGWMPSEDGGALGPLNIHVLSSSGSGTVKNYDFLFDGYSWKEYPGNTTGIYLGKQHVGSIVFDNCDLQYADGYYASHNDGNVIIKNSEFTNLNRSCVRLLGSGSEVRNCTFNVDLSGDSNIDGDFQFTHGVVWEGNDSYQKSGGKVVNCRFNYLSRTDIGSTMRAIEAQNEQGALTIKGCEFNIQTRNTQILNCDEPTDSSSPHNITVENITVAGSSTKNSSDHAIRIVGRDSSVIRDSCIDMSQDDSLSFTGDIDGILFKNSNNCEVNNSTLNFNGQTIEQVNSSVQTSGNDNGNCSL